MADCMSKIFLIFIFLLVSFSSCKVVPFILPKEQRIAQQEKRVKRLERRRKKAQYKLDVARGEGKRKLKKLEKIESKLPGDTLIIGLDSASLAKEQAEVAALSIMKSNRLEAREVMNQNKIEFNTAKIKTKMSFLSGGNKQSFSAHFILEKDKSIWVTIRVGLEVARAYLTPTRVQAINKINKVYYDYSFEEIKKLINVDIDFMTLQDIIIGNAVGSGGEVFEFSQFGGTYNIGLKDTEFLNKLTYNKSDSTLRQIQLQVFRGNYASNILGMLGEYEKELGRFISTKRVYNVEDSKGKLSLEMDIQKVDFDGEYNTPYKVPKSYKPAPEK